MKFPRRIYLERLSFKLRCRLELKKSSLSKTELINILADVDGVPGGRLTRQEIKEIVR